jgi:hypothetical protein
MDRALLDEITACLRQERTIFYYFRDRYALLLLQWAVGQGRSMRELRHSQFAGLLNKPTLRNWLSRMGKSRLEPADLDRVWGSPTQAYRVTMGQWPLESEKWSKGYHQTTRPGHNLVLQLNFSMSHNRELNAIVGAEARDEVWTIHPVAGGNELTMAWARLDIDLETDEALIEEIQSDWIRDATTHGRWGRQFDSYRPWAKYADRVLWPHARLWPETMLSAALWFLHREIGIRRIFYHTYESGVFLKNLGADRPPRSLYTDLPRKFCFRHTHSSPLFLRDIRHRVIRRYLRDPETRWFVLELPAA